MTDYSSPSRNCDIVMKGGVASGTVYPLAICELATTYHFRNVGGTSAGAIAAAATAAAQCGRRSDPTGSAFRRLERLPAELGETPSAGGPPRLFSLFQPQDRTARAFAPVRALLEHPDDKLTAYLLAVSTTFWASTVLGALPGLAILVAGLWTLLGDVGALPTVLSAAAAVAGLAVAAIGAGAAATWGWWRTLQDDLPANFYGFCNGFGGPKPDGPGQLTQWLSDLLDALAGKSDDKPLLFKDLWGEGGATDPEVNLRMVTTNLTLGRPHVLPFDEPPAEPRFFFKPREFGELFPQNVVRHMVDCARGEDSGDDFEDVCPLPSAGELPVIVATRLSLSFPLLLSAVPLYLRRPSTSAGGADGYAPCWFSDGGICSNFPVHFFDSPLPRWPTFAINLRPLPKAHALPAEPCDDTWMAAREGDHRDELAEQWFTYWDRSSAGVLQSFLGAVLETMQNWRDSAQLAVPGYRDRVVHIGLRPHEGGLNLAMSPELIGRLGERGRCAGARLKECFARTDGGDDYWDTHRWTRFRASAAGIEELLARVHKGYVDEPEGGAPLLTYAQLVHRAEGAPPSLYPWSEEGRALAIERSDRLTALAAEWDREASFAEGAPTPFAQLRPSPHI